MSRGDILGLHPVGQHAALPGLFAHPMEVVMALLDGEVEVHARQFFAEGADVHL